jgi:hypothetical protein
MIIRYFLINFLSIVLPSSLFASNCEPILNHYSEWGSPIKTCGSPAYFSSSFSKKTSDGSSHSWMDIGIAKGIAFRDDSSDDDTQTTFDQRSIDLDNRESFDGSIDLELLTTEDSVDKSDLFGTLSSDQSPFDSSSSNSLSASDSSPLSDSENEKMSDLTDSESSQLSSNSDESVMRSSIEPIRSIGGIGKFSTPQGHFIRQKLSEKDRHLLAALSDTFVENIKKEESKSSQASLNAYIKAGGTTEEFYEHVGSLEESGIEELYVTQSNKECFPTPLLRGVLSRSKIQDFIQEGIAAPRSNFLMPEISDENPLDPKPFLATPLHAATREERSLYKIYATHLDAYKNDDTLPRITRHAIESLFLQTIVTHNFRKLNIDIYHFFYCIDYIDIDKSLKALSSGNNPINKSGDVMHFHHVTQQEGKDAYMVLISGSIHQELHARIHFENTHKFRHQSLDRATYTTNRVRICEKLLEELMHINSVSHIQKDLKKQRQKLKIRKSAELKNKSATTDIPHDSVTPDDTPSKSLIKPVKTKRGTHLNDDTFTTFMMPPISKAPLS